MTEKIEIQDLKSQDFDIIILAGQSNCVGYGEGFNTYEENEDSKTIYRNPKKNKIFHKKEGSFCYHSSRLRPNGTLRTGFYLYFGEHYVKEYLKEGRKLLFLRSAVGGTGFSDKHWGLKDDLYLDSIATAKELLKINPKNEIKAILWHQGETDSNNRMTKDLYFENLDNLVKGYRKELNLNNVPFIAGDFVPEWKSNEPYSQNITDATKDVINKNELCGFVESTGLEGNSKRDCIHFNSPSNVIFGKRYFDKYKEILNNSK